MATLTLGNESTYRRAKLLEQGLIDQNSDRLLAAVRGTDRELSEFLVNFQPVAILEK